MRRLLALLIYVFFFSTLVTAQEQRITIATGSDGFVLTRHVEQLDPIVSRQGNNTVLDYAKYTDNNAPGKLKLPFEHLVLALPPNSKPSITCRVLEKKTIPHSSPKPNPVTIAKDDTTLVEKPVGFAEADLRSAPQCEVVGYFWFRDFYCATVKVRLAAYNYAENSTDEVLKYELKVGLPGIPIQSPVQIKSEFDRALPSIFANAEMAEQFRTQAPAPAGDTTNAWLIYDHPHLKLGVAEDRIYRLGKADLVQAGINVTSINPKQFQLFYRGAEIPVYVAGEDDNSFDANDYIEFYGQKNYSPLSPRIINPDSLPYNELLDKYTDTSYYFLRWGISAGKRAMTILSSPPGTNDSVYYYISLLHNEKNALYQQVSVDVVKNQNTEALDSKGWFSNFVYTSEPANGFAGDYRVAFPLTDIVRGKQAFLYTRFVSAGSNKGDSAHTIAVGFKLLPAVSSDTNLFKVQQRTINRNQRVLLGGAFPSDSLKNSTNIFVLRNYKNTTNVNYLAYDWFEVEYPRYLIAKNDSLSFEISDGLPRSLKTVTVRGLTPATPAGDYVLYQTKPEFRRIINFTKTGGQLSFADTVGAGSAYYLYPVAKIFKPATIKSRSFVNLRNPQRKADYVAITHPVLYQKAKEYCGFIKNAYAVDTTLILIEDIFDEFAFGNPDPAAFRLFLQSANAFWRSPKPSYLSLLGIACYDYKRNFFKDRGYEVNSNLVPSYGEPVSDAWFSMWDENNPGLPQLFTGRIPSKSPDQLDYYLTKHRSHLQQNYDDWNKRTIFFSGGDGNDTLQLQTLRTINNIIIDNFVRPAPLALGYEHFYKTAKPPTDFGPFEPNYVRKAIDKGGLFISYIGHSGTRTWDNSISDPNQLLNKANKYPLVTDFGCSTNKFAEPDIESFGALFVNSGQTIAYIGNTSLGFTSTSSIVPIYFYESLLKDGFPTFSIAHLNAKNKMLSIVGTTGTYRVFTLTNALLGDPIISMQLPKKPNLNITTSGVGILPVNPNDQTDSVQLKIAYQNLGTVASDTFSVRVEVTRPNQSSFTVSVNKRLANYLDSISVPLAVKGLSGQYRVRILLDATNRVDEIYENDNSTELTFNVASLSIRPLLPSQLVAFANPKIMVLNPSTMSGNASGEIVVQTDTATAFNTPVTKVVKLDTLSTLITVTPPAGNRRYFYRTRVNSPDTLWSSTFTFFRTDADYSYFLGDKFSFEQQSKTSLDYENGMKLVKDTVFLSIKSGGGNFSKYGSILKNSTNLLDNTFGWGMGVAVFDPVTFRVEYAKLIQYGFVSSLQDSLANLINALPAGRIVCMNVVDDGWVGGTLKQSLKNAIKSIGSKEIDNLAGREPWVIFGVKGAAPGTVPEIRKSANYLDILTFDTTVVTNIASGSLLTEPIANVTAWSDIVKSDSVSGDGSIVYRPIGIKGDETADTLAPLMFSNGRASLSVLNNSLYKKGRVLATLNLSTAGVSPVLRSIGINFTGIPELGLNDQTLIPSRDTLYIGQAASVKVILKNAGDAKADSFKVYTDVVNPDNTFQRIDNRTIGTLPARSLITFTVPYNVSIGEKNRAFRVTVDPDEKVREHFKDNNVFQHPFIVGADTSLHPSLRVLADSVEIIDGDYVRPNPVFRVELSDPSLDPITDSTFVTLYFDEKHIYYNDPAIAYSVQSGNPKLAVTYSPLLKTGEHELRVIALSASRRDTLRLTKTFRVSQSFTANDVYNYPNPFSEKTYFTFQLSQQPEEAKIKIFTIAGRLIREISLPGHLLRAGFNKQIEWDGRDGDGDEAANGVYLAKLIFRKGDTTHTSTLKVVITR